MAQRNIRSYRTDEVYTITASNPVEVADGFLSVSRVANGGRVWKAEVIRFTPELALEYAMRNGMDQAKAVDDEIAAGYSWYEDLDEE